MRTLFLRALGAIYLVAFVSLWLQVHGLVGSHGILPVSDLMGAARSYFDSQQIGIDRYRLLPTFAWISSSDAALTIQCALGTIAAVLVIFGVLTGPCLVVLWALYLSLSTAGQDFLGFQWDTLLTETGALAILFAPWEWRLRPGAATPGSPIALWLLRWLGFRLMVQSGAVKLLSGDASWRDLTALTVHYQTQPLPTWVGWYAHQLPGWWQTMSCAVMFAIELGAPWLLFAGKRARAIGALAVIALQLLILLTGNYTFFNWLAIALFLLWFEDKTLARPNPWFVRRRDLVPAIAAAIIVPVSVAQFAATVGWRSVVLAPGLAAAEFLSPLRSVNTYGLFAVMTTTRHEIVIEGSNDGVAWQPYEFPDKPGDVMRRPRFVAPFQPRLDWQMWFAALGTPRDQAFFAPFLKTLLDGSPEVLRLLETNPFPNAPPHLVRAELYDYRFTTWAERRATGAWWVRTQIGEYVPPISLK